MDMDYNTEMRTERMKKGGKSASIKQSNTHTKSKPPVFQDAAKFLGVASIDGEIGAKGTSSSNPKGSKSPGPVKLKKGTPAPAKSRK